MRLKDGKRNFGNDLINNPDSIKGGGNENDKKLRQEFAFKN